MPWAIEDVFSFVLYYKQRTYQSAQEKVARWTSKLVDLALAHEGRYYLPYQLHASKAQFERAYPEIEELRRVKKQLDPTAKLSNELWRKYLGLASQEKWTAKRLARSFDSRKLGASATLAALSSARTATHALRSTWPTRYREPLAAR